ncbi:MAG: SpoIIE family protein phosphatase [Aggregatilineales bacterium]
MPSLLSDRRTARPLTVIAAAVLLLMALIGFLTFIPAGAITAAAQRSSAEAQRLLAGSLARRIENFFNTYSNVLISLASRPAIQSVAASREVALKLLEEAAKASGGQIVALVRIARDGSPRYAYPPEYNARIQAGEALPWSTDATWVNDVVNSGGIQFARRSTGGGVAYLLVTPVTTGLGISEVLALELNLVGYLNEIFAEAPIGESGQLWVLTTGGVQLYSARPQPEFRAGTAQIVNLTETTTLTGYPSPERESVVVPVYTSFTQSRTSVGSLVLVLSRTFEEANQVVAGTLQQIALFSFGVIAFVALFGILVGGFLLAEANRRRREEGRRETANTLLEISRTLNSSLELNVVLERILANLSSVIRFDSASIFLLDDDGEHFETVAERGSSAEEKRRFHISEITGAREVVEKNTHVVITDCLTDPRWQALPGSPIKAWLGVPLRVRDQVVGVLNINSHQPSTYTEDDIAVAVAFADQAGVAIQNARSHELQIRVYEAELETARAIQTSLLPQEPPPVPQVQVAARSIPARQVSGDYYQYFVLPDGKLGVAVGDVSGKGIPAALLMAVITTALRDEILRAESPSRLLSELNQRLLSRMRQNNMNSGLLITIFDPQTRHAEIAAGGMLSPYVRTHTNGSAWQEVEVSGYPLGAAEYASYRAETLTLAPESLIVFVTDGVIEAKDRNDRLFGFERFEALLAAQSPSASADEIADNILEAVRVHLDGQEPQDDLTIVVLKALPQAR